MAQSLLDQAVQAAQGSLLEGAVRRPQAAQGSLLEGAVRRQAEEPTLLSGAVRRTEVQPEGLLDRMTAFGATPQETGPMQLAAGATGLVGEAGQMALDLGGQFLEDPIGTGGNVIRGLADLAGRVVPQQMTPSNILAGLQDPAAAERLARPLSGVSEVGQEMAQETLGSPELPPLQRAGRVMGEVGLGLGGAVAAGAGRQALRSGRRAMGGILRRGAAPAPVSPQAPAPSPLVQTGPEVPLTGAATRTGMDIRQPVPTQGFRNPVQEAVGEALEELRQPQGPRPIGPAARRAEGLPDIGSSASGPRQAAPGTAASAKALQASGDADMALQSMRDLRDIMGADKAAARLDMPVDRFREMTDPTGIRRGRRPVEARMRELDRAYRRALDNDPGFTHTALMTAIGGGAAGATAGAMLADEDTQLGMMFAGAMVGLGAPGGVASLVRWARRNPQTAQQVFHNIGSGVTTLRAEMALSGAATFKNIANAIGAPVVASAEKLSIAPLREALRVPTNAREFGRGFMRHGRPQDLDIGISGQRQPSQFSFFSRVISGIDHQAIQSMRRAGMTDLDIDRLLVRRPITEFLSEKQTEWLQHWLSRQAFLFQRTPANVGFGGANELSSAFSSTPKGFSNLAASPAEMARRRAITQATLAIGAGTGAAVQGGVDNPYLRGLTMAMGMAFFGVRALPFAVGGGAGMFAAGGTGREAVVGLAPFPDFGLNIRSVVSGLHRPSGVALAENLREASGSRDGRQLRRSRRQRRRRRSR